MLINPKVAFSSFRMMKGDNAIHDINEFTNNSIAYVILVMIDDLKVPPIDVQNAEHAAAPKQDASEDIGISGKDMAAPMVDNGL